mgnify:CR=1 FL=1
MKKLYFLIVISLFSHAAFTQTWTEFNSVNKASINVVDTYLNNDTLSVYGQTGIYSIPFGLANQFETFRFASGGASPVSIDTTIVDTNLIVVSNFIQEYKNTFVKFGTEGDVLNQQFKLFYSIGDLNDYSNKVYLDTPSSISYVSFFKKFSDFYLIALANIDANNHPTAVLLKLDSNLNVVNRLEVECLGSFCKFNDIVYVEKSGHFIGVTGDPVRDSVNQQMIAGSGLITLDSNLNIIYGSISPIRVKANLYLSNAPVQTVMGALAPVSDTTFMLMSAVVNFSSIGNPTNNPNPTFFYDLAIGVRGNESPYSEQGGLSQVYGSVDSSENGINGQQQILKYDSNLFVTALTKRFYIWNPEPWDTEAAIYGLNEKGDLYWEYHIPFNDYCWVRRMDQDTKGGLWVTGQCTESVNNTTRSFAKVTYIDSVAYWPRISTTVSIKEPVKQASEISVFPNPAQDQITVRQYYRPTILHFLVLDQSGRIVKESTSTYTDTQINISELKSGLYFLRITDSRGNFISTEKVVKF